MPVGGVRPPLDETLLAPARVSLGEPACYVFGLERLAGRRKQTPPGQRAE